MTNKKKPNRWIAILKPLVFLTGLFCAIWIVLWIEKTHPSDFGFYRDIFTREEIIRKRQNYPLRPTGQSLSDDDIRIARIAWKYFENNYNPETGLVNSVDQYHATTFWDLTSSLTAVLSARELRIIDDATMHHRLETAFNTLENMVLYDNKLPNKVYNTITLAMTTYDNRPTERGTGWSSMDIGRFLGFCKRILVNYPEYTPRIERILKRWSLESAIKDATLIGIGLSFKDGVEKEVQEGKLGYEEYCAKGFSKMGFDVLNALSYTDFIKFVDINGMQIGVDVRETRHHPSYNYILSDPYVLDGIEYGFDINSLELGYRVLQALEKESNNRNLLVCVGENHIDQPPYFVYNTLYSNGKKWNCVSESGDEVPELKTFSTGAAFGWYYLFDTPFTQKLFDKALSLYDEDLGWYSGVYEESGEINKAITANVNSLVLCAVNYKQHGSNIYMRPTMYED